MKNSIINTWTILFLLFYSVTSWAQSKIISHTSSDDLTTVTMQGINSSLNIMHITDSHITIENDDTLYQSYSKRMANAYADVKHHKTGNYISRTDAFRELIDNAIKQKVDLIALTGDILNYPSNKGVEFLIRELERSNIPYIYTAGNHDWHLEGMSGSSEDLRRIWNKKVLFPLYQNENPYFSSKIIKGINIVSIDNSTYQITKQQLEFYKEQKNKGLPIVLLMHIPIFVDNQENFNARMGDPTWGASTDKYYLTEKREQWPESGNKKETVDFLNEVYTTPSVIILSGHTHENRFDVVNGMIQLTSKPARDASYRILRILPQKL